MGEDLHSMTGWNTFCKAVNLQTLEITDEKGKVWLCQPESQKLWIYRDEKPILILGQDLKETDKILGYMEDFIESDFTPEKLKELIA